MVYHFANRTTIITVALLLYFLGLYAQKPSDAQGVYVHYSGLSLGEVLAQLSNTYHIQFSYSNDHLELNKKIYFHSEGRSLEHTLTQLFQDNNILYAYIGNQIVLKPSKKKDQRKKDRQERKKKRDEEREERNQQTLERGTLFDFDIHSEIVGTKVVAQIEEAVEEEEEREYVSTKDIQPLIAKTIDGEVQLQQEKQEIKIHTLPVFQRYSSSLGQISLFPFLSTDQGNITRRHVLSFNVFYGINGGLNGLEIGLMGNSIKRNVHGLQVGGFFNTAGGHLYGTQISALLNITKGEVVGLQVSGLWNLGSNIYGSQVSILSNIARDLYGMQFTWLINAATDVYGLQISGLFNFANGKLFGVQAAGFGNVAWGGKSAVQFAGLFNTSAKAQLQVAGFLNTAQQVDGAQIAAVNTAKKVNGAQIGAINIAKELNGVQIGLINSSLKTNGLMIGFINIIDSVKGVPLGLINIVRKNGYNRFELSGGEAMFINFGVKFGSKQFYHILHTGWRVGGDNVYSWSFGVGAGTKIDLHKTNKKYHFNLELLCSHINEKQFFLGELNLLNQFKFTFDIAISERLSLFFGPTFNALVSRIYNPDTQKFGSNIMPYSLYNETSQGTNLKLWIGLTAGMRF